MEKNYKIIIEVKSVYGNDLIYPVCDDAKTFTKITGTKTLSPFVITYIKRLGYEILYSPSTIRGLLWN